MEFNDQSIVLRVGSFRESDLWVRMLSPVRGIFSAFAFGGSRSRKRFSGCLDTFNEVLFHIKATGRGSYLALQEASLIKGPKRLRSDWKRMGMAMNCAKFMESLCPSPDAASSAHKLFRQLLIFLEESEDIPQLLPVFFRSRLALEQGVGLDVHNCSICRDKLDPLEKVALPAGNSGLLCSSCSQTKRESFNAVYRQSTNTSFSPECFAILRHIMLEDVLRWNCLPGTSNAQKECAALVDSFLQYNTGLYWHKGRYCKA